MEKVIDCPVCYDKDACFEDVQETFKSYMCFNCGFMSNSNFIDENAFILPCGPDQEIENIHHTISLIEKLRLT